LNKLTKLLKILSNKTFAEALLKHGVAAGVEHEHVLEHLNAAGIQTVIDVGANRGQFSLATLHCIPGAKIIAFEPLDEPAQKYMEVFAGNDSVTLFKFAIGDTNSHSRIHVSRSDDSSSLRPISALQNELFRNTAELEERTVVVKRLQDIVDAGKMETPVLLKIDVQGCEKEVLAGAGTLLPVVQAIYVECSFMELYEGQALADEIIALLQGHGFRLKGIYNLSYNNKGTAIQGDFLFLNMGPQGTH
jgi:FkbM family methyltransferase